MCDGIFLNYTWNKNNLLNTQRIIESDMSKKENNVFVGIDIFGRGQVAKFHTNEVNYYSNYSTNDIKINQSLVYLDIE